MRFVVFLLRVHISHPYLAVALLYRAVLTVFNFPPFAFQNVQPSDSVVSFHLRPPLPTSQNDYTNWEMATPGGREENYRETHRDQPSWENGGAHPQIPMPLKKLPQTPMDKVTVPKSRAPLIW